MIRIFDIFFSVCGLLLCLPIYVIISTAIALDSRGGVFYSQSRVGRHNRDFLLLKFRTMRSGSDKKIRLTIGSRDPRITRTGYWLRKYKLDELPQLINVLKGEMSLVGPRPEVRKYVDLYTPEQMKVLDVKPGITDYASLEYFNENDILGKSSSPEEDYIRIIMPAKLELNMKFISNPSPAHYLKILACTIKKIF